MKEYNQELEITLDGISQSLLEIKDELVKYGNSTVESSLKIDLLNKISESLNQTKQGVCKEDMEKLKDDIVSGVQEIREQANDERFQELNDKMEQYSQLVNQPSIVKNHYSIDFKSSKTFIIIVALVFGLMISIIGNSVQWKENRKLSNNDLKYRFIKMRGGVDGSTINRLENIFYYSDSTYLVKNIKKQVLDYEYRVEQQIRKQEQVRMNEEKNKQLNKEIKDLGGK